MQDKGKHVNHKPQLNLASKLTTVAPVKDKLSVMTITVIIYLAHTYIATNVNHIKQVFYNSFWAYYGVLTL